MSSDLSRLPVFTSVLKPVYVAVRDGLVRALERRAGIRTTGIVTLEELGLSSEHRTRYQASSWFTLKRILPRTEVGRTDVFVEFGSGMGRVLCQAAARYPLLRIEGVEMSSELTRIARANIEGTRYRLRCTDIRLVAVDVLEYEIPDDLTVAYFYNPFQGPIFVDVVDRLVESVARAPRRLRVIYLNPVEEQVLLDAGFRIVRRARGLRPGRAWSRSNATALYELTPSAPGGSSAAVTPRAAGVAERHPRRRSLVMEEIR